MVLQFQLGEMKIRVKGVQKRIVICKSFCGLVVKVWSVRRGWGEDVECFEKGEKGMGGRSKMSLEGEDEVRVVIVFFKGGEVERG